MATAAPEQPGAGARLLVGLQYLLPQHGLSRIVRCAARSRRRWLKNALIRRFVGHYHPELRDAERADPLAYESFNAFFTRRLRPGARDFGADAGRIAAPVDGAVSMAGSLEDDVLLQAKGHRYTLGALLAGDEALVERYRGGRYATIYLAPHDYHRIHMPLDGTLRAACYVPGRLFSVNAVTTARVPRLFARNERVICDFDGPGGAFAVVLVGALFVGSLSTAWHGEVNARRPRRPVPLPEPPGGPPRARRGDELGCFNMGSTVILLLAPGVGSWRPGLAAGSVLRAGEAIGRLQARPA
jgi:phosphatidylserine decarboxylase